MGLVRWTLGIDRFHDRRPGGSLFRPAPGSRVNRHDRGPIRGSSGDYPSPESRPRRLLEGEHLILGRARVQSDAPAGTREWNSGIKPMRYIRKQPARGG